MTSAWYKINASTSGSLLGKSSAERGRGHCHTTTGTFLLSWGHSDLRDAKVVTGVCEHPSSALTPSATNTGMSKEPNFNAILTELVFELQVPLGLWFRGGCGGGGLLLD